MKIMETRAYCIDGDRENYTYLTRKEFEDSEPGKYELIEYGINWYIRKSYVEGDDLMENIIHVSPDDFERDDINDWNLVDNIFSFLPENKYYYHICKDKKTIVFIKCDLNYFVEYLSSCHRDRSDSFYLNYYLDANDRKFHDIPVGFDIMSVFENPNIELVYIEFEDRGVFDILKKDDDQLKRIFYDSYEYDDEDEDEDISDFYDDFLTDVTIKSYTTEYKNSVLW